MARRSQEQGPDKVKLVSPDGEITREVEVGSKDEVSLRFDGYLPQDQAKLQAPEKPTPTEPTTVGTNA